MEENKWKKIWDEVLDLGKTFICCAIFVFLFTTFIARPVQVDGLSMYPNLQHKEVGFMNIMDLSWHGVQRYDIVVVKNNHITGGDAWVKRVIAMPGDSIYAKDDIVYVNDKPIEEPYLDNEYVDSVRKSGRVFTADFEKVILKENEYFLMGDNRVVSHDSRAIGPFNKEDFKGKDIYVFYPFNHMRLERNINKH